jgi:hypothetical protein
MLNRTIKFLGTFSGTAANSSQMTFEVPRNGTYYGFIIKAVKSTGALTDAELSTVFGDVEFLINAETIIKEPALRLKQIFQTMAKRSVADDGLIPISSYIPYWDLLNQRYSLGYSLNGVTSATLRLNIAAIGALTGLSFQVYADVDTTDTATLGAHLRIQYQDISCGALGSFDNNTVNTYGKGYGLIAQHFELVGGTAPTIDNIFVDINNRNLQDNILVSVYNLFDGVSRRESVVGTSPFALSLNWDGANVPIDSKGVFGILPMGDAYKYRLRATVGGTAAPTSIRIHSVYCGGI